MNQKKKWVERHGCIVRNRRSRAERGWAVPRWFRNLLNRRVRRRDAALLRLGRWDDFDVRVARDAARLFW